MFDYVISIRKVVYVWIISVSSVIDSHRSREDGVGEERQRIHKRTVKDGATGSKEDLRTE